MKFVYKISKEIVPLQQEIPMFYIKNPYCSYITKNPYFYITNILLYNNKSLLQQGLMTYKSDVKNASLALSELEKNIRLWLLVFVGIRLSKPVSQRSKRLWKRNTKNTTYAKLKNGYTFVGVSFFSRQLKNFAYNEVDVSI